MRGIPKGQGWGIHNQFIIKNIVIRLDTFERKKDDYLLDYFLFSQ